MIKVTVKVDVSGLHNYEQRTLPEKIQRALDATALNLESDIKTNFSPVSPSAPGDPPGVDTGFLRASIHWEKTATLEREVIAGAEYAQPLEYGTYKIAPRPFMRPALYRMEDNVAKLWVEVFKR